MSTTGPQATLEETFLRFRDGGDVTALAEVFDRTAPQLLLLAGHVTPDGGAAEDLLQETFLQAMARAEQWDPSRPLLPWLGGILRHRAQDLARRLALRRPAATLDDVASSAAAATPGPAAEAEAAELLERVTRVLEQQVSPYREALVLRLVHGLEPTEIAHALGRPPATVRTQLKRGLEALRARLPEALASALAVLLLPGRGLAATRDAVLAAAARQKAAGASALATSTQATARTSRWLVGALAAGGLALGGYLFFANAERGAPGSGTTRVADAPGGTPFGSASDSTPNRPDARRQDADESATGAETRALATGQETSLRGRIVRAGDGAPLPGGSVEVSFGRGRFVTDDPTFRTYPDPITVRADSDGTFEVTLVPERSVRVWVEARAPGYVSASAEFTSLRQGRAFDLGDVPLVPGVAVGGRVVDEEGQPVAGVTLSFERRSGGVENTNPLFGMWSGLDRTTDANGVLPTEILPAPGSYGLEVSTWGPREWRLVSPTSFETTPGGDEQLEAVVSRAVDDDSLGGRVVDERGLPVADVTLALDDRFVQLGSATSRADGSFWLPLEYPGEEHELHLAPTERRFRLVEPGRKYARGRADHEVRVERLPTFDVAVDVIDGRSGLPVTDYGLQWSLDYWEEAMEFQIPPDRIYLPAAPEQHPGGRCVIPDVPPGKWRLAIHPADPTLAPARLEPFTVQETGAEPVRIVLRGFAPLRVQVADDAGVPVEGVDVTLIHGMAVGERYTSHFSVEQLRRGIAGGRDMIVKLETVTTDGNGVAVLSAPVAEPRLRLRLVAPHIGRQSLACPTVGRDGAALSVEVERRARLLGRIGPPELIALIGPSTEARRLAEIVTEEDSDLYNSCPTIAAVDVATDRQVGRAPVLPDGTFDLQALPPGDVRLELSVEWRLNPGYYTGETVDVGRVHELAAGEVREVAFEIAHFAPAHLRGSVLVDGAPWTRGEVGLVVAGDEDGMTFRFALAPGGTFSTVLRPGRYLPFVTWEDDAGDHYLFADDRFELAAGAEADAAFRFEHRRLRIALTGPDGEPAAGHRLRCRAVDFPAVHRWWNGRVTTDEQGLISIDPAPPGRVQVYEDGEGGALLGELAAGADPVTEARLVLRR